jgi:hypothetical protein
VDSAVSDEQRVSESAAGSPARGYSWPPFEPGNVAAVKHGAYATLKLAPRAEELAVAIRAAVGDAWHDRYTLSVEAAALAGARVEAALGHLLELDEATIEEKYARLDDRARGWLKQYLGVLERFGLVPEPEALRLEISGRGGAPIEIEGRPVVGLADVVTLARELGASHLFGLGEIVDAEALAIEPAAGDRDPDPRNPASSGT